MRKFPFHPVSPWLHELETAQPTLAHNITADVVVIGGGFTGLYTALELRKAGLSVVVLEKDFSGAGGSGRNSGYCDGIIGKDLPSLLKLYKIERARELCDFAMVAVRKLEAFIADHQIECEYEAKGNIMAAVHPKQVKKLEKVSQATKALGLEYTFLDREAMRERGIPAPFIAGVFDAVGGILNPGLLIRAIRKMAIEKGVQLFENTKVLELTDSAPVQAHCEGGTVTAQSAVIATNVYANELGWKKRLITPICAAMCETEPLTPEQLSVLGGWHGREGIYTAHEQLENYRLTARNTIITGGKHVNIPYGFKVPDKELYLPQLFTKIESIFRERFPAIPEIKVQTFWAGWIGMTLDFMPAIGATGKHRNVHYGLGFSGHGIPQTLLVAELIADQVQGKKHPLAKVLQRKVIAAPPEPIKWIGSNALSAVFSAIDAVTDRQVRQL